MEQTNWEQGRPRSSVPPSNDHFLSKTEPILIHGVTLPHWDQENKYIFITFRLADSIPAEKLHELETERHQWHDHHPTPWDENTEKEYHRLFSQKIDRWLDLGAGSCILSNPEVASIVERTLLHDDGRKYHLTDFVIMSNHVHVLTRLIDGVNIKTVMQEWKSVSSHRLRKLLGQEWCGWMENYYDRHIRNVSIR